VFEVSETQNGRAVYGAVVLEEKYVPEKCPLLACSGLSERMDILTVHRTSPSD